MTSFLLSQTRRAALASDAAIARTNRTNTIIAFAAVIAYNFVGLFDIISTIAAIEIGVAEEANPLMRAIMDHYGVAWIAAKLLLQIVISGMVLWFPHRIVLFIFIFAVWTNGFIVLNNFRIALGF
ncbi:MAG: DUF5658 family protein [Parvularculaceae bacterium]|nr:hypothetical protein [Parvularculaceae bacterium]